MVLCSSGCQQQISCIIYIIITRRIQTCCDLSTELVFCFEDFNNKLNLTNHPWGLNVATWLLLFFMKKSSKNLLYWDMISYPKSV